MACRIELSPIELQICIGCGEEERRLPQPVRLTLHVQSREALPACQTDQLQDTLDAALLRNVLIETTQKTRVHTLERLGQALETAYREQTPRAGCDWQIRIEKPQAGWTYVHAWAQ